MKSKLLFCCCILLIVLFTYTAVSKWIDFDRFLKDLTNQPIPQGAIPFLAWVLTLSEFVLVILILREPTRKFGFAGAIFFMSLFTGYTGLVLLKIFNRIPCSCGGVIRELTWPQHLLFNVVFTGVAITGYVIESGQQKYNT